MEWRDPDSNREHHDFQARPPLRRPVPAAAAAETRVAEREAPAVRAPAMLETEQSEENAAGIRDKMAESR